MEYDAFQFQPEGRDPVRKLASFARVISFDKRGTGLSHRVAGALSLEVQMGAVRAVLDANGSEQAALLGALTARRCARSLPRPTRAHGRARALQRPTSF